MSRENPFVFTRANCDVVSEFARSNSLLKQTMNSESHWNRITILNGIRYDKEMVLDLIVTSVYPHELYPCMYREEEDDTFFLFKNGFSAVMTLCSRKLFLVNPETDENIELTITAQYMDASALGLNPMKALEEVIKKRMKDNRTILDLRNLRRDPEMADLYCSFNSLKFWEILLPIKKKYMPSTHSWILSHNRMVNLDVLESPKHEIPVLDLRCNRITREGFRKIGKHFKIGHLLLEGNPITAECETAWNLIKFLKSRVDIRKLDFLNVDDDERTLRCFPFPNYIVEPAYKSFVDHFMFHSFIRFEKSKTSERKTLSLMYHENATYSVSLFKTDQSPLTSSNPNNQLALEIDSIDHNLICEDEAWEVKKYDNILFGRNKIANGLAKIPEIRFGYSSFSVDVPMAYEKMIQIFVNGVCRSASKQRPRQYYFSRCTFLVPSNKTNGEWLISNDMWNFTHIHIKTNKMGVGGTEQIRGDFAVMLNPQLKDKDILRRLVGKMTKMKPDWVERFLEESDWDFEFTLQSFTDQFKADVIPVDAFDIPQEKLKSLDPLVQALKDKQAKLGIETM